MLGDLLNANAAAAAVQANNGQPIWTTAYSASKFTNNNLGNNGQDPSMQATLNDPHAAILAPPTPPPQPQGTGSPPGPAQAIPGSAATASGVPVDTSNPTSVVRGAPPVGATAGWANNFMVNPDTGGSQIEKQDMQASVRARLGTAPATPAAPATPLAPKQKIPATPTTMPVYNPVAAAARQYSRTPNTAISKSSMVV